MASIQEVLLASQGDLAFETFAFVNNLVRNLEMCLYEDSEAKIYQRHYITLLVLNECMTDDKISSLPLLLKLTNEQKVDHLTVHYLKGYMVFMR